MKKIIIHLEKNTEDYENTIKYLKKKDQNNEKLYQEFDDIINPILTILSIMGNRIADSDYQSSDFDKDMINLKCLLNSKGMDLSYFPRGSKYQNEDTSYSIPDKFIQTDDESLDSTVARCDQIGYSIDTWNLKRNGKISLYRHNNKTN